MKRSFCLVVFFVQLFIGDCETADVFRFANIYGSHMVLQQAPQRARIWGFGEVGQKVMVTLQREVYCAEIKSGPDNSGTWSVTLSPQSSGGPYNIQAFSHVNGTKVVIELKDVLFGDVWVCNGQSNMELPLRWTSDVENAIKESVYYDKIRLFMSGLNYSDTPFSELKLIRLKWSRASPEKLGGTKEANFAWNDEELYFSAACWYYGKTLYDKLKRPIGLVAAAANGAPVESWSPPEALKKCGVTSFHYPGWIQYFRLSNMWNAMIHPFVRMTIRGVIYYQGETNAFNTTNDYSCMFPALIDAYRANWYEATQNNTLKNFPFGFVQLSTYKPPTEGRDEKFAWLRWNQTAGYGYAPNDRQKNVFMAVAMDLGNPQSPYASAHPTDKKDVGERLATASLAVAYGQNVCYSGPLVKEINLQKKGNVEQLKILYTSVNETIEVKNHTKYPVVGFEVLCKNGGEWRTANVVKKNDKSVVIELPANCHCSKVRYAWDSNPCVFKECLIYSGNLPSPPFIRACPK